jgi:hypothetical protein
MSTSAITEELDGPRRGRLGYVVIGIVVAICAAGWAIIMAHAGQRPGIAEQTITYRVVDDSTVQIHYSVSKPKGKRVRCVVDALDRDFVQVASMEVTIPPGTSTVERTDTLHTTGRANAARVKDCRVV